MYTLNEFINKIEGENGIVLTNSLNGQMIDLDTQEGEELIKILEGAEDIDCQLRDYLQNYEWIIEVNKKVKIEKVKISDFSLEKLGLSDFRLSKVLIELSTKCSLDCIFCDENEDISYTSCTCKRWSYEKKKIDYDKLTNEILRYHLEKIIIIGGDVFYDSFIDLECFLENLKNKNFKGEIVINTNGMCIDKRKVEFLKKFENIRINVIFFGGSEKTYLAVTRKSNVFKKVIKNIQLLKSNNIRVNGTFVLTNANVLDSNLSKLQDLNINIGIKYVYNEDFNSSTILNNYKSRIIMVNHIVSEAFSNVNCCMFSQIFISSDMKVYPCPNLRSFILGDLEKEELYEIFTRNDYKKFWFLPKSEVEECKFCKYRNHCIDCRGVEYAKTKKLYKEYYCDIAQKNLRKKKGNIDYVNASLT